MYDGIGGLEVSVSFVGHAWNLCRGFGKTTAQAMLRLGCGKSLFPKNVRVGIAQHVQRADCCRQKSRLFCINFNANELLSHCLKHISPRS